MFRVKSPVVHSAIYNVSLYIAILAVSLFVMVFFLEAPLWKAAVSAPLVCLAKFGTIKLHGRHWPKLFPPPAV